MEIFKFGGVGGPRATKWLRARGWGRGLGLKDRTRVKEQGCGVGAWVNGVGQGLGQGGHWFCDPKLIDY